VTRNRRPRSGPALAAGAGALLLALAACTGNAPVDDTAGPTPSSTRTPSAARSSTPAPGPTDTVAPAPTAEPAPPAGGDAAPGGGSGGSGYPWHTNIVSTTFWVGEIFDPNAADGSQVYSTYDSGWLQSYGGCDGVSRGGSCETEARSASNGYFPTAKTPRENPFYLDLPFDDINDRTAFAMRDAVVPWAGQEPYASHRGDGNFSYMKNRWVQLRRGDRVCYGQIEDAGPAVYHDAAYVFGSDDARPASREFNGAGMDVSPALTGCLGFPELDGEDAVVDWRFVEASEVPEGPWARLVTTSGVR
jgi:hypothetical protein